jgi:hypothetical protein
VLVSGNSAEADAGDSAGGGTLVSSEGGSPSGVAAISVAVPSIVGRWRLRDERLMSSSPGSILSLAIV